MQKNDRRIQRTRKLLQDTLIGLMQERGYDTITVQEIVDEANLGRTTFYLHYNNKDELFLSCHESILGEFEGALWAHPLSRDELLAPQPPSGLFAVFEHLKAAWGQLEPIFQSRDGELILRHIRDGSVREVETNLRTIFADVESAIPLEVLAAYLVGAKFALFQWWLEKRRPYTTEQLAHAFHRLQRAAIRDAFGLVDEHASRD
jgi:AcrR family transcriptional regulator